MSLIERLPAISCLSRAARRRIVPWIVPLVIILVWRAACSAALMSARVLRTPSADVAAGGMRKHCVQARLEPGISISFLACGQVL